MSKHKGHAPKPVADPLFDGDAARKAGAVRTAWIIGLIAVAFFIGSLVQGHRGEFQPSWEPPSALGTAQSVTPLTNPQAGRQAHASQSPSSTTHQP